MDSIIRRFDNLDFAVDGLIQHNPRPVLEAGIIQNFTKPLRLEIQEWQKKEVETRDEQLKEKDRHIEQLRLRIEELENLLKNQSHVARGRFR